MHEPHAYLRFEESGIIRLADRGRSSTFGLDRGDKGQRPDPAISGILSPLACLSPFSKRSFWPSVVLKDLLWSSSKSSPVPGPWLSLRHPLHVVHPVSIASITSIPYRFCGCGGQVSWYRCDGSMSQHHENALFSPLRFSIRFVQSSLRLLVFDVVVESRQKSISHKFMSSIILVQGQTVQ